MAKPNKPPKSLKKAKSARSSIAGPAARWPQALLAAWLGAAAAAWLQSGGPPTDQALPALPAALAFGTTAAWAVAWGGLGGVAGGACGLALAGLALPVALTAKSWWLLAVGAALGLAARGPSERPALRPAALVAVHVVLAALLGLPGAPWVAASAAGVLAAHAPLPLAPPRAKAALIAGLVACVAGAARTADAGFVRVVLDLDRALLAEWGDSSRVLPARSRAVFWVGSAAPVFRATLDGPTFLALPPPRPGPALPARTPDAVDLAELGFAPQCEALTEAALAGDSRARVQVVLRECKVDLGDLAASDPALDAALVLRGQRPRAPTALLAAQVELPLNDPGAVLLAAKTRLGAPKAAGSALVDGTPFDRALLLAHLSEADRRSLRELLTGWVAEVPGPPGQPYRDALSAVSLPE